MEDADISAAADQLKKTYGDKADLTAARRADEALRMGDDRNYHRWLSIFVALGSKPGVSG